MTRDEIIKQIAENITEIRVRKGISLSKLSRRCGIGVPHLCRYGRLSRLPSIETLLRVAHGLRVPISSVIRGIKHA